MTLRRKAILGVALAMAFCISAGDLFAFEPAEDAGTVREKINSEQLYIGNVFQPATRLPEALVAGHRAQLAQLGAADTGAHLDLRSGRWGTLILSQPLLPGSGKGNNLSWNNLGLTAPKSLDQQKQAAWQAFVGFLQNHDAALGFNLAQLPEMGRVTIEQDGELVQVFAERNFQGIPVRNSYISGMIRHGNLVLFASRNWGDIPLATTPTVQLRDARDAVQAYVSPWLSIGFAGKEQLVIVPTSSGSLQDIDLGAGFNYRLAWALQPRFSGVLGSFEALVDAHTNEVIAFQDTDHHIATPRNVVGGVFPVSNDGTPPDGVEQAGWPMPWTDLTYGGTTSFTDGGGNLQTCFDGSITTTLDGQFMRMNDNCGGVSESGVAPTLDLGTSGGTDCTTAGTGSAGNTHASRSGFFELNQIAAMGRGQLPNNSWLQQQLTANMNIAQNCNATWNGTAVNFYTSGGGCFNTGEIAGVFDHEWGHGMDDNDANGFVSNSGEGMADMYAALRLNDSCIGRGFRATACTGFGDPCTVCTGVREIDWNLRVSGVPHDVTWSDTACQFVAQGAPCGGSVHCEGQVYAEAVWDLFNIDLQAAPYNMDLNTALETTTHLVFQGTGLVGNWIQCVNGSGGDGCNADGGYLNLLAADDDNGNLADGTPHMSAIFAAFDRHGAACATPTVQDSGCAGAPTIAPVVAPTALDRGAQLTWAAVAGATEYEIFRTDGVFACDFGKTKVGTTSGLEFVDSGLQNGRDYSYIVVPKGSSDSCFGPASSCTAVTPAAGTKLALEASTSSLSILGGDGDVFLDNCEIGSLDVDLISLGSVAHTNPRIVGVTSPSHPGITFLNTFPVSAGSALNTCEIAEAAIHFQASGLSFNETVEFEVEFTSDEYSGLTEKAMVTVSAVESDLQSFASRTYSFETDLEGWKVLDGIFDRTGGGGGDGTTFSLQSSGGLDGICDVVRSPLVELSPTSTMSMWNNWDIEVMSGGSWWDRASAGIVDAAGVRSLVTPDSGRAYNATVPGTLFSGCNDTEEGWAGLMNTWGTSGWSATALQSGTFAGGLVQLEVVYGTDGAQADPGFWFDQVTFTDIDAQEPDVSSDVCTATSILFLDGFESSDFSAWDAAVTP